MKILPFLLFVALIVLNSCNKIDENNNNITIFFSEKASNRALDGRLLLMLSTNNEKEPRFQINSGLNAQIVFGVDVENLEANQEINFDNSVFGFPYTSLKNIPPGDYYVQGLLHTCLLYTSPSPRDRTRSRMPSSA